MSGIDAVIFDLGNVLIAVDEHRGAEQLAKQTGQTAADVQSYFHTTPHVTELALGKQTRRQFYRTVAHDLGFTGSYEEFAAMWNDVFTPMEPMVALAQSLARRRPRLILSNTNVIHADYILEHYPWLNEFDDRILSHEVGLLKPDAAIYQLAVKRTGVPAERVLFIDDLSANVQGACGVGMQTVQFESAEQVRGELTKRGVLTI